MADATEALFVIWGINNPVLFLVGSQIGDIVRRELRYRSS